MNRASSVLFTSAMVMVGSSLVFTGIGFAGTLLNTRPTIYESLRLLGRTSLFGVVPALILLSATLAMRRFRVWPTLLAMAIGVMWGSVSGISAVIIALQSLPSLFSISFGLWLLIVLRAAAGITVFVSGGIVLWQYPEADARVRGFDPTINPAGDPQSRD